MSYLRRRQAAEWLLERGIPCRASTLAKLAVIGGGPKYIKFGRIPLYREVWLSEWVAERLGLPQLVADSDRVKIFLEQLAAEDSDASKSSGKTVS